MKEANKTFLSQIILYASGLADEALKEAGEDEVKINASKSLLTIYHSLIVKLSENEKFTLDDWGFIIVAMKFMSQSMENELEKVQKTTETLKELIYKLEVMIDKEPIEKINELFD